MDIETLFLQTLDDLESRARADDAYTLLLASGLIRKLFLDGARSLVDRVNRIYRLKLEFAIIDTQHILSTFAAAGISPQTLELLAIGDALDPDSIPNAPRRTVNRDTFFGTEIQISEGIAFTVSEIVRHQAHIRGGVHAGAPRDDREQALSKADDSYVLLGGPPGLLHLRAISTVILKALAPLRVVVQCSKAIAANPCDGVAYYNRGTAYASAGRLEEAISDFDRAIQVAPNHPCIADAYYNRGRTLYQLMISNIERFGHLELNSVGWEALQEESKKAAAQIASDFEQCLKLAPDFPGREQIAEVIQGLGAGRTPEE